MGQYQNIHPTLRDNKLPMLDQGMSALFEDLEQRGLLEDTVVIWMGEFSRTPRINQTQAVTIGHEVGVL